MIVIVMATLTKSMKLKGRKQDKCVLTLPPIKKARLDAIKSHADKKGLVMMGKKEK